MKDFIRKLKSIVILMVVLLTATIGISQTEHESTLPLEKRLFILSKTYAAIPLYFAHWQGTPKFSLDSLYQVWLQKAIETEDRFQFDLLMLEFIARLNNGHSWYTDRWLWSTRGQPLGFYLIYQDAQWVVTQSLIDNVRPGEVIVKIDGQDFEDFFQQQKKYLNASGEWGERVKFPFRTYLFPKKFTLETASGTRIEIDRQQQKVNRPPQETTGRWIEESKIAYLKIPGFDKPNYEAKALELVKQFGGAEVLIVDVRGNGGGNTPTKLIGALQDRPYRFWTESTPLTFGLFKAYSEMYRRFAHQLPEDYRTTLEMMNEFFDRSQLLWIPTYQPPDSTLFSGELIILTDRRCASACEDFIVPFKDNGRALIVGERTMGSSGQPYLINFDDQISVAIGTKREYLPDGSPFEGRGIEPDVLVQPTVEDLKAGRDVVLEKVLSLVRRK